MSIWESFENAFQFLGDFWWLWLPLLLLLLTVSIYRQYIETAYEYSLDWITLELRIPEEMRKSPKTAEQVFAGLHGIWFPLSWQDRWLRGRFYQDHISLEIVSRNGLVSFLIHTPQKYRNLIEAHFYAHYPSAEITEVDDPYAELPVRMPDINAEYDTWIAELKLTKEDAYPIRLYPEFEESGGIGEEKRVDPIAGLAESFSILKAGENLITQYIIRPTSDDTWIKEGQKIVDEKMGRAKPPDAGFLSKFVGWIDSLIPGGATAAKEEEGKKGEKQFAALTPGEQNIVRNIQLKASKLAFECGIRIVYVARKDIFNLGFIGSVIGAFKQFFTSDSNGFTLNIKAFTSDRGFLGKYLPGKGLFAQRLAKGRKALLYFRARRRNWVKKAFILNIEELATIFHLPSVTVRAPAVPRIEAKRGAPPTTLPVEIS